MLEGVDLTTITQDNLVSAIDMKDFSSSSLDAWNLGLDRDSK